MKGLNWGQPSILKLLAEGSESIRPTQNMNKDDKKWEINPDWVAVENMEVAYIELGKDGIWRQGVRIIPPPNLKKRATRTPHDKQ